MTSTALQTQRLRSNLFLRFAIGQDDIVELVDPGLEAGRLDRSEAKAAVADRLAARSNGSLPPAYSDLRASAALRRAAF
jgi:hypothetical protein